MNHDEGQSLLRRLIETLKDESKSSESFHDHCSTCMSCCARFLAVAMDNGPIMLVNQGTEQELKVICEWCKQFGLVQFSNTPKRPNLG